MHRIAIVSMLAAPIVFGLLTAAYSRAQSQSTAPNAPLSFEVASIKPNNGASRGSQIRISPGGRFNAINVPVKLLIETAYNIKDFQFSGGPGWLSSDHYDIEAKSEGSGGSDDPRNMSDAEFNRRNEELRLRIQSLLADRFKLVFHRETKELPIYALLVAKNGPKLQEAKDTPLPPPGPGPDLPKGSDVARPKGRGMMMGRGTLRGNDSPLSMLADALSRQLGRTVIDKTGLQGKYDFTLNWTPDESQAPMLKGPGDGREGPDGPPPPDPSGPSIFTALQEQLGLKLEAQKGPIQILVIDHVERPSEN